MTRSCARPWATASKASDWRVAHQQEQYSNYVAFAHSRLCITPKAVFEQPSQDRVAVRYVCICLLSGLLQSTNDVGKAAQTLVDALRFFETDSVATTAAITQSLRSGQVDKIEHGIAAFHRGSVVASDTDGKDAMRTRRSLVHQCRGSLAPTLGFCQQRKNLRGAVK